MSRISDDLFKYQFDFSYGTSGGENGSSGEPELRIAIASQIVQYVSPVPESVIDLFRTYRLHVGGGTDGSEQLEFFSSPDTFSFEGDSFGFRSLLKREEHPDFMVYRIPISTISILTSTTCRKCNGTRFNEHEQPCYACRANGREIARSSSESRDVMLSLALLLKSIEYAGGAGFTGSGGVQLADFQIVFTKQDRSNCPFGCEVSPYLAQRIRDLDPRKAGEISEASMQAMFAVERQIDPFTQYTSRSFWAKIDGVPYVKYPGADCHDMGPSAAYKKLDCGYDMALHNPDSHLYQLVLLVGLTAIFQGVTGRILG